MVGQYGTHVDPPAHFDENGITMDEIPLKQMILPLIVLDDTPYLAKTRTTPSRSTDLKRGRRSTAACRAASFVALRTDMYKDWDSNPERFKRAPFPAWAFETIKFLYEQRGVTATGHEAMDTDTTDKMDSETYILQHGHYQIEVMANLDKVPPKGALIVVTWPKVHKGLGFPARVVRDFARDDCAIRARLRRCPVPTPQMKTASPQATCPYLLQHKHNPVDWWPWGPEALGRGQALEPADPALGRLCRLPLVPRDGARVVRGRSDRAGDERAVRQHQSRSRGAARHRPDLHERAASAGRAGRLAADHVSDARGEPVWGGTYFPKESRFGRPAFIDVLREVARLFREEPDKIEQNRAALLARLADKARPAGKVTIGLKELDAAAMQVGNMFDPVNGGLRGAPKFPQPAILEMLWRAGMRTSDARFFETVEHSLERMSEGGIYDHLGGGFSRYSVDERWLVPHFEKMLYDNAQLLEAAGAGLAAQRQAAVRPARARNRRLAQARNDHGGGRLCRLARCRFGRRGGQVLRLVDERDRRAARPGSRRFFARHYDVTADGNFEGHNILNRLKDLPRSEADEARLASLRAILLEARAGRVRPGLDDKVLADWNGLMIAALVNAGIILDEPAWLAMAKRAFDFIAQTMTKGDRLGHSWRAGKLLFPGLASDFAAMIRAALALYEATGERVLSRAGARLAARLRRALRRCRHRRLLSLPPTTPTTCCCGRIPRTTTPRPIRTRSPRRIWCGLRCSPATTMARRRPTG